MSGRCLVAALGAVAVSIGAAHGRTIRLARTVEPAMLAGRLTAALAAAGPLLLVGAAAADEPPATSSGSARLYDPATGALVRSFASPGADPLPRFASSVATLGDDVIASGGSAVAGVHRFAGTTGELLRTYAVPPGFTFRTQLYVAAGGPHVVVADPGWWEPATLRVLGAAYLFDAETGALRHSLVRPSLEDDPALGRAMIVLGDRILLGAPFDDVGARDGGAVYEFDARSGALLRTIGSPALPSGVSFGFALAVVGRHLVVGAPFDGAAGAAAGATYVLDLETGALEHVLRKPEPAAGDHFGFAVAARGAEVLVSAPNDAEAGADAGAAYAFDPETGSLLARFSTPADAGLVLLGTAMVAVGSRVAVAAAGGSARFETGVVALYEDDSCGDGVLDPEETCDDGDRTPGDGCDADCRQEPAQHFLCAAARARGAGGTRDVPIGSTRYGVGPPSRLCVPVSVDGSEVRDPAARLVCHRARVKGHSAVVEPRLRNVFGRQQARADDGTATLCLRATLEQGPPAPVVDDALCYGVERLWTDGPLLPRRVTLETNGVRSAVRARSARSWCRPVDVGAGIAHPTTRLMCYDLGRGGRVAGEPIRVRDALGAYTLGPSRAVAVCVQSHER